MDFDLKQDCSQLVERINVFKTAFSENEDDERYVFNGCTIYGMCTYTYGIVRNFDVKSLLDLEV